ncbi:MAG: hydroxymethylglutaryl-CoA synthase family protein [Myxococcaceae bacterium]|nr:hydroxymethylglutaryl-CoA synthase family protein [Myxococcaceae bacterium]
MERSMDIGISGLALYAPPLKVSLERWCAWTGNQWDKVSAVVGQGFRQPARHESIYTMAANAVLKLIDAYDIDPREVGFFALGTESSTDNAAGAVIVRGMVDRALIARGQARIARACEVPEFKHACLGGVYAVKGAVRYLATDGRGKKAIVVCGDIAEYERGSSGEQTQGAGTVAILLEENPKLCRIDLANTGSSSDFRGVDFRKPVARHFAIDYAPNTERYADFPVFNGKYSTFCYLDAVTHASNAMFERLGVEPRQFYQNVGAIFMHRPFHWMPVNGMTAMYVWALAESEEGQRELAALADVAKVSFSAVLSEIRESRDLFDGVLSRGIESDPYPAASAVVKAARNSPTLKAILRDKMHLGSDKMRDLGNLYTAALPAWLAAGFEHALESGVDLTGQTLLAIGYGSGDAAEAMPLLVSKGWREAASKIGFARALDNGIELTREQYEQRHDGGEIDVGYVPNGEFVVERVGHRVTGDFQDIGVEYYRYVPDQAAEAQVVCAAE